MATDPVPHGQSSPYDAAFLPFRAGHPHPDELNEPFLYGAAKPDYGADPIAFVDWVNARAQAYKDTGSPISGSEVVPSA